MLKSIKGIPHHSPRGKYSESLSSLQGLNQNSRSCFNLTKTSPAAGDDASLNYADELNIKEKDGVQIPNAVFQEQPKVINFVRTKSRFLPFHGALIENEFVPVFKKTQRDLEGYGVKFLLQPEVFHPLDDAASTNCFSKEQKLRNLESKNVKAILSDKADVLPSTRRCLNRCFLISGTSIMTEEERNKNFEKTMLKQKRKLKLYPNHHWISTIFTPKKEEESEIWRRQLKVKPNFPENSKHPEKIRTFLKDIICCPITGMILYDKSNLSQTQLNPIPSPSEPTQSNRDVHRTFIKALV